MRLAGAGTADEDDVLGVVEEVAAMQGPDLAFRDGTLGKVETGEVLVGREPGLPVQWMQRLKRVFAVDIETCPECGGNVRVIACIEDPPLIEKILGHVQRRQALIAIAARGPPDSGNMWFIRPIHGWSAVGQR
jgi:hypothetical protein